MYSKLAVRLEFKKVHPDAQVPWRKRETDAGYDIASIHDAIVLPHSTANIKTGIKVACPPGYFYAVEGRSSMWKMGIAPYRGIIDSTFNGDLELTLYNISDVPYQVMKGDRVAQIIIYPMIHAEFTEVVLFSPDYDRRGSDGFGSSGR